MWCQVQATSALTGAGCPLVRSKHAMCTTADGHIYLYGGRSMANKPLRDLWRFDTAQDVWEEVLPRVDSQQTSQQNIQCTRKGGVSAQSSYHYSSTTSTSSSSSASSSSSSAESSPNSGTIAENKYEPPPALQEHTIVAARNKLYLFGGQVGFSSDETPLWIFDLVTARWSKFGGGLEATSKRKSSPRGICNSSVTAQPLGRRAHSAVLYHRAGVMSVYGGYQDFKGSSSELWTFHLERQSWTQEGDRYQKSATPPGRHNHSAVVYKDAMYVYGGMTDLQLRSDFWSWSYKTKKWSRIKTLKNPGDLCCHSAIVVADSMFIYGGERGEGQAISELWRYRFESGTWQQVTVQGMLPGCRTRHAAVAIPFFNFNFNNNSNSSTNSFFDHNQEEETSFISCTSPTMTKDEQTQVEFDYELQPTKKSISLCFEEESVLMSPAETEPKKKLIRSSKSSSFRRSRSSRKDTVNPIMTTSLPAPVPPKRNQKYRTDTLSTDEEFLTEETAETKATTSDKEQQQQSENNQNVLNHEQLTKNDGNSSVAEQTAVRMRPRRPLLTRQRPYSDFYGGNNNHHPHHQYQEEFESVNEQLTEKQLKRRSVQESMSYYSLCFPTPPARVAKHKGEGDGENDSTKTEEKDDNKTKNISSETLISNQQQQQSSEVVMRDNCSLKRRMRKANLQLRELQTNFTQNSQPAQPATAFTNPAYYSLSLDISPDFEKELPPPPSCHDSMASPLCSRSVESDDEENDEQLYSFGGSSNEAASETHEHGKNTAQHRTTHTDLDLLEDYLEPEEMLEIVTSTDSLDGEDTILSPTTVKMRTFTVKQQSHQTPAHKMPQPQNTSSNTNLPPHPPPRQHRTHRAPSVSHSSSGYQSLVLVDGMTASFDLTSNPSLSNSSSFADTNQSHNQTSTATTAQSNLDNLARSITLNLRNRTNAGQQNIELRALRSPLEQMVPLTRESGQKSSNHQRSRSLERNSGNGNANRHHNKPHWQPNITEVIREVIVPRSPALALKPDQLSYEPFSSNQTGKKNTKPLVSAFGGRGRAANKSYSEGVHQNWQLCMYVFGGRDGSTGGSALQFNKQPITIWKLYI